MAKKKAVQGDGQDVRERLLSAALGLFTERGYAATSVREIVELAGVTKPVLYYHFGNKEGIYREIMRPPFERLERILDEVGGSDGRAYERICNFFGQVLDLLIENLSEARLMYAIYYGPPQGAPFIDFEGYHLKLGEVTAGLLEAGMTRGEFMFKDPEAAVWALIGALNFAMEEQLCQRKPAVSRKGMMRILDVIFSGAAPAVKRRRR